MQERILIVEDDAIAQLTLAQYLQDLGFPHSVAVNNGKDAIAEIERDEIALAFLDIRIMGEWDGITTAQKIRERYPTLPVVFLTANTDQETLKRAQRTEPSSIIRKPYDRDILLDVITSALDYPVNARIPKKEIVPPPLSGPDAPEVGMSVTNAKGVLVSVNPEFCRIHHCTESEAVGKIFTDFFPENVRKFIGNLHREFIAGRTDEGDGIWTIINQQGTPKQVSMKVNRLSLGENSLYVVTTLVDMSQQQAAAKNLARILKEKDAFAREIHHRVKNNLNVISGLFYLQAEKIKDRPDVYHLFQESISRIKTMSVVHEQLYDYEDYVTIDLNRYVQLLADAIQSTFQNADYVTLSTRVGAIQLDVDRAVACGLILNEIMTNCFKYAFTESQPDAEVLITGSCHDRTVTLTVEDNGAGLPEGFDVDQEKTLGIQLIKTLTDQLSGTLEMRSIPQQGTSVSLTFGT